MKNYAFTLIELLIVVAIIAILAAIAVPNFLEAQTRSKVSRYLSDTRSAVTALESYRIDNNKYPPPDGVPAGSDESIAGPFFPLVNDPPENYLPRRLTTPISYISSLPIDIFPNADISPGIPQLHASHYVNDDFNANAVGVPWAGDITQELFVARTKGALLVQREPTLAEYDRSVTYLIHSHGPDLEHDDFLAPQGFPTEYDSSNGTISDGDIFYFGPGRGFTSP